MANVNKLANNWAIMQLDKEIKTKVKQLCLGCMELLAKSGDEQRKFLLINNISHGKTKKLMQDFSISTCIFNDTTGCKAINLNCNEIPIKSDIKNLKELISFIISVNDEAFELYEIEPPRPSYFQNSERYIKII